MDARLFEVSQTGNVENLLHLVNREPLILNTVGLTGADTPLHIAVLAGHVQIVKELIRLRKQFAYELNQDGFTPLHIAAATGNTEIMMELLKVNLSLCLVEGKERRIPLHYAAIKGRNDVIGHLLSASVGSIKSVTSRGETALHLAVKNNQFKSLLLLVECAAKSNRMDVINMKDEQGNTILHLAAARKQHEVVDLLLKGNSFAIMVIEVNCLNQMGFTALDVFLLLQSEAGDREIEAILQQAGALTAINMVSSPPLGHYSQFQVAGARPTVNPQRSFPRRIVDLFRYDRERDTPDRVRDVLLVIAILLATATFQAALSLPFPSRDQSVPSPDVFPIAPSPSLHFSRSISDPLDDFIQAILVDIFLFCNTLGFFTSLHMIYILTIGFPLKFELLLSLLALGMTYIVCLMSRWLELTFSPFFLGVPFLMAIAGVLRRTLSKQRPPNVSQGVNHLRI